MANILACRIFGYSGSRVEMLVCIGPLNTPKHTMLPSPLPFGGVNELLV